MHAIPKRTAKYRWVWDHRGFARPQRRRVRPVGSFPARIHRNRYLYALLLPGLLATATFSYGPLFGIYMAFSNYKVGRPIFSSTFVGLKYFKELLVDSSDVLYLIRNTVGMNVLSITVGLLLALIFAVILNECRYRGLKRVVQTASFFPFFISWVIVYNIFNVFLAADTGVINVVLKQLGLVERGFNFLGEPRYAWGLIVTSNVWKYLGYNSVIFLAAISGIDQEMYEAASIDGADRLHKIFRITLPHLLPTVQVLLIMNAGWLFISNFDQFYLFTNFMNRSMMEVFDLYVYRFGIKQLNYSYATAVSVSQSVAGIAMIVFVNWASKRLSGKGIF